MRRTIILVLGAALFGILATVVVASQGADDSTTTGTTETQTVTETETVERTSPAAGGVDISGPCDEAEHVGDPRCAGVNVPNQVQSPTNGVDISGPCDEAEHANDPRCTGAGGGQTRVDNSGPGSVNSGRDHDDDDRFDDDRFDDHDNSGPGSGDDDFDDHDDDSSGHGSGGGDDDSSGHGSGGDDD